MKRAKIIVKGEVQGVGYRGIVRKIAIKLNIVGRVKNIKPYDVQIVAEGEEKNLRGFIEQIKIREFPVSVKDIETTFEEATGEFESFEIERGDLEEELGERLDVARDIMTQMIEKQDQMLGKQDTMIEKQDETIKVLGEKIDSGFSKMDENFTTLRGDYGRISAIMEEINESLKLIAENLGKNKISR